MQTMRVEKFLIHKSHPYYGMLDDFCFKSKNLYNYANYQIRQAFIKEEGEREYIGNSFKMMKMLRAEGSVDFKALPHSRCAEICVTVLDQNWRSFFASIKDWGKSPEKYKGKPNLPKYLPKDGRNTLTLDYKACKVRDGLVHFPKTFNGFTIPTLADNVQQVRILPRKGHMVAEIVFKKEVPEQMEDNGKYVGIDIGLDNIAALTNNVGIDSVIINGKPIKAINQLYNKEMAHYRSVAKRMNDKNWTKRMSDMTIKRDRRIEDILHNISKNIITYAVGCGANTIIIGNNKRWKTDVDMGKVNNQKFVSIPHSRLINMIVYKAEDKGINVDITEESYTSGTSFLDGEKPVKECYDKSRRKYRGLFKSASGQRINADVNGSLQIIKKVVPEAFNTGVEKVKINPIKLTI